MKILVVCYSKLHRDPRLLVQIKALSSFHVVAAGFSEPNAGEREFVQLDEPSRLSKFKKLLNFFGIIFLGKRLIFKPLENETNAKRLSNHAQFDLIIVSDLDVVPALLESDIDLIHSKVVFDAHEYYLDFSQGEGLSKSYNRALYKSYLKMILKHANILVTVSPGLQSLYSNLYGGKIEVIKNLPEYQRITYSQPGEVIRLVHHGAALPKRELENMISSVSQLGPGYELHFYLLVMNHLTSYYDSLKSLAAKSNAKIIFHDPVETSKIAFEISQYDLGIYNLPPKNLNSRYALPNKLFEFIQGRLGVVIGPSEDMKSIVNQWQLGRIADSFKVEDFTSILKTIDRDQILKFKNNAESASKTLSSETSCKQWQQIASCLID